MASQHDPERQPLLPGIDLESGHGSATHSDEIIPSTAIDNEGTSDTPTPDDSPSTKSEWRVILAIASSWIGVVLASIDSSVMATLTGPITRSFGSFQLMSWFVNAYIVSVAVIQPLSGKLSTIYGRKNSLLLANFLFLIGNVVCGVATENWHFIGGRVIAGLGGGCIHSISTFIISDFVPLRSRGYWQGVSNIAYGSGFAVGGYFGGVMEQRFGWRWAFLSLAIMTILSLIPVAFFLTEVVMTTVPSIKRVDFLGSFTLALALLFLLFGAISGGNTLPWSSPLVYIPLAISPCLLIVFGYIEERIAKEPVIPVRLLARPTVLGSCFTNLFIMMGYSALLFYLPLYLEVRGMSVEQAGLRLMPASVGVFIGSLGAGALMNATGRYYLLGLISSISMIAGGALVLALITNTTFSWPPYTMMLLVGTGIGGSICVTLVALISAAEHEHHATLTSASYAFRSIGQVLGVTIAGAIFQNVLSDRLHNEFDGQPEAENWIHNIRQNLGQVKDLPAALRAGVTRSYGAAFDSVWTFILSVLIASFVTSAIIRENRLHRTLDRR